MKVGFMYTYQTFHCSILMQLCVLWYILIKPEMGLLQDFQPSLKSVSIATQQSLFLNMALWSTPRKKPPWILSGIITSTSPPDSTLNQSSDAISVQRHLMPFRAPSVRGLWKAEAGRGGGQFFLILSLNRSFVTVSTSDGLDAKARIWFHMGRHGPKWHGGQFQLHK